MDQLSLFDSEQLTRDLLKSAAQAEADMLQLPDFLQNPQRLAQMVYEFWINSMETDRVEFASLVYANDDTTGEAVRILPARFEDLDADVRMNLVESVQTNITQPLLRVIQDAAASMASDKAQIQSMAQSSMNQQTSQKYLCYCCSGVYVSRPGQACTTCVPRRR